MSADHAAIQRLISLYSDRLSQRDWSAISDMFTPDAHWEMVGQPEYCFDGAVGIAIRKMVEPTAVLVQIASPAVTTVTGDQATARSTVHEAVDIPHIGKHLAIYGVYEDIVVRVANQWLFKSRRFYTQKVIETPLTA